MLRKCGYKPQRVVCTEKHHVVMVFFLFFFFFLIYLLKLTSFLFGFTIKCVHHKHFALVLPHSSVLPAHLSLLSENVHVRVVFLSDVSAQQILFAPTPRTLS